MNNLLKIAVEAHGGLKRWDQLKSIHVKGSVTGGIWYVKSRPDVLKNIIFDAELHNEKLVMTFPGQDKKTTFEPNQISLRLDGKETTIQKPKQTFLGQTLETPWEDVHVAYFSGEALWTYLTSPFLYTYPGFETEELEPWEENGETWRRLEITFPDYIASHTKTQISYFGPDGLLRRHDYTVDILGGASGANYATNYQNVNGIIVPSSRRIYAYEGEDHRVIKEPLLVAVDMNTITFN